MLINGLSINTHFAALARQISYSCNRRCRTDFGNRYSNTRGENELTRFRKNLKNCDLNILLKGAVSYYAFHNIIYRSLR